MKMIHREFPVAEKIKRHNEPERNGSEKVEPWDE